MATKKLPKTLTKQQQDDLSKIDTVAGQIRYLAKAGMSEGDISRTLSAYLKRFVRPQWVNNVLTADRQAKQF